MKLQDELQNLFELYGSRNAMFLRGEMRAMFLHHGLKVFSKLIRQGVTDKELLANALASVFSRTAAYADSFVGIPVVESMCEKYPSGRCAYCGFMKCNCDPNRKEQIKLAEIDLAQLNWSVSQWISHLDSNLRQK